MAEEIKEILDRFNKGHDELTVEEYILLENYITSLQQAIEIKNQRIKEEQQEKERYIKSYNGLNTWNKKLQQENEKLKYNARGQVNDYFKDKYTDEVLKNAELKKENEELKQTLHNITINGVEEENTTVLDLINENERLNNIINELEEWLKEQRDYYYEYPYYSDFNAYGSKCDDILEKLKELKESEK